MLFHNKQKLFDIESKEIKTYGSTEEGTKKRTAKKKEAEKQTKKIRYVKGMDGTGITGVGIAGDRGCDQTSEKQSGQCRQSGNLVRSG